MPSGERRSGLLIGIAVAVALLTGCQAASNGAAEGSSAAAGQEASDAARVHGEYLVELRSEDVSRAVVERAFADAGVQSIGRLETSRPLYVIRVVDDPGPDGMARMAGDASGITRVQPNYRYDSGSGGMQELD